MTRGIAAIVVVLAALAARTAFAANLWLANTPVPASDEIRDIPGVRFQVIKKHEPQADGGFTFLHGVAVVWYHDRLFASFAHNRGTENTATEQARFRVSSDAGLNWSDIGEIDAGNRESGLAVSHGVFHVTDGRLWAFHGAFYGRRQNVHTRAYLYDEQANRWEAKGIVATDQFWPMQPPVRLANGNWLMAGFQVDARTRAAVAIAGSHDPLKWRVVVIAAAPELKLWGESTVLVRGHELLNIARFGARAFALTASSLDDGATWTPSQQCDLPMTPSKPFSGRLSNGRPYLIGTVVRNATGRRAPLTIAVGGAGEMGFREIWRIRDAENGSPGESHPRAALAYPYAVEHDGLLYVGYSNSGGRTGMNINSAELAVFPISALQPQ